MIMKKAQFHSILLLSIVNKAQIASLRDIKREIIVFTSACLRSGLNTTKLSKRQIQAFIYNVVSRSN